MSLIWTINGSYQRTGYNSESDLEAAIIEVQRDLFGANRVYLDIKKKIGNKGAIQNIPDGYLIDLNGKRPRLFVVENELAAHDPLRHSQKIALDPRLSYNFSNLDDWLG